MVLHSKAKPLLVRLEKRMSKEGWISCQRHGSTSRSFFSGRSTAIILFVQQVRPDLTCKAIDFDACHCTPNP